MFVIGSLMLVIWACSLSIIVRFATRPLRTPIRRVLRACSDQQFPFRRLLDRTDFDYLRGAGLAAEILKTFKTQRRKIARLWLRDLAADFNSVDSAARLLLVTSQVDRPGLAAELFRQRATFCWYFLRAEAQITLAGRGCQSLQPLATLEILEMLCVEMRKLADAAQTASAAVASS
jgi:hypothetical protein